MFFFGLEMGDVRRYTHSEVMAHLTSQGLPAAVLAVVRDRSMDGDAFLSTYWTHLGSTSGLSMRDAQAAAAEQRRMRNPPPSIFTVKIALGDDGPEVNAFSAMSRQRVVEAAAREDVFSHFHGLISRENIGVDVVTGAKTIQVEVSVPAGTSHAVRRTVCDLAAHSITCAATGKALRDTLTPLIVPMRLVLDEGCQKVLVGLGLHARGVVGHSRRGRSRQSCSQ